MRYLLLGLLLFVLFTHDSRSVENDRMIDVHTHIGSFRGYEIGEKYLLESMDRYGIDFGIVSNLDGANLRGMTQNLDEMKTNQVTAEFVREHQDRFRGLLWARPNDGSSSNLESFLKQQRQLFVGIKFHPEFNQFDASDKRLDPYLALCEQYKLVAVFHSGRKGSNSDPEKIYETARRHPTVPFVLYHMSFFGPHDQAIDVAAKARNRRDALIYLETSQVKTDAVLAAIKTIGSEGVLFGTDATYYGTEHYQRYQSMLNSFRKQLHETDYTLVTSGNAIRLFGLEFTAEPQSARRSYFYCTVNGSPVRWS